MTTIIKATDYGYRKVVAVCLNHDDSEAVHSDGTAHPSTEGPPAGTDPSLKSWEWCQDCIYNWQIIRFDWTGEELYKRSSSGSRILKSDTDLLNEINARIPASQSPATISTLEGVDL